MSGGDDRRTSPERRVLLFESDFNVRTVLRAFLQDDGWDARFVDTADGLMAEVDAFRPAVVVPQVLMPDGDGLRLCRSLRSTRPAGQLGIVVTSFLSAEDWVLEAGADAFLKRPLSERRLLGAVNRVHGRLDGSPPPGRVGDPPPRGAIGEETKEGQTA